MNREKLSPLAATASPPYVFVGWSGLSTGNLLGTINPITITVDSDKTIRARFATAAPLPAGLWHSGEEMLLSAYVIGGHNGALFAGASATTSTIPDGRYRFGGVAYRAPSREN